MDEHTADLPAADRAALDEILAALEALLARRQANLARLEALTGTR